MHTNPAPANTHEKERLRAEIETQVREFLRRGGAIDILDDRQYPESRVIGAVWYSQLETPFTGL